MRFCSKRGELFETYFSWKMSKKKKKKEVFTGIYSALILQKHAIRSFTSVKSLLTPQKMPFTPSNLLTNHFIEIIRFCFQI